jgi:NADH dehydrogenase
MAGDVMHLNGGPAEAEAGGERVLILGAGFGGLEVAKRLGAAGVRTTIVDRQNHHLFQPLLYQVATAALSPADIAEPIRRILRRYASVEVVLGDVTGVNVAEKSRDPRRVARLSL